MPNDFDVVIVGGGMGGLLLALSLARRGRRVALLERQAALRPPARGELLQPNGLRILDHLGLMKSIQGIPAHRAQRFHFTRIGGGDLCCVDYRDLPPPWNYTLITLPHHLLQLLLRELGHSDRVEIFMGTEFKGLQSDRGRIVGIQARRGEERLVLKAPMVVGSDGARSEVRSRLGIPSRLHVYREGYLTMILPRPPGMTEDARYYVGRGQILGVFPVSDDQIYLFYMIPGSELDEIRRRPVSELSRAVAAIDSRLGKPLETIDGWERVGYMPCFRLKAASWTADGAALIGDAAHAMNPHVAQGRNQAMEDAVALAEVIEDGFKSGDFNAVRLRRYEERRRPPVECLQRMGDELTLLWNASFPPLAWLRDLVFRGMERHPSVRVSVMKTISGLEVRPLGLMDRLKVFMP